VPTVIARFHHLSRDLDQLESNLVGAGAEDAHITGYTVALTFPAGSQERAAEAARRVLDRIGATRIKITKHRAPEHEPPAEGTDAGSGRPDSESAEATANLMAKLQMDVFGHP
jgi:hypothetical protein